VPILYRWAFRQTLALASPAIGPLGAFSPGVNVATSAAVGPAPNTNKTGVTGAGALLALPSRSLVGFLSLLNGLITPTEEKEAPVTAPQSPKPRAAADVPQHRSAESDKGGKNVPGPQTESTGSARVLPLPSVPHLSAVPASGGSRSAPVSPATESTIVSQIPSFAGFPKITHETTGSNLRALDTGLAVASGQPSGSIDKSTTGVAFALRLTPQSASTNSTPLAVSLTQAPTRVKEVATSPTAAKALEADAPPTSAKPVTAPEFTPPVNTHQPSIQVSRPSSSPAPSSSESPAKSPQQASPAPAPLAPARPTTNSDAHSSSQEKNVEPSPPHVENPQPRIAPQVSGQVFAATGTSHELNSPSRAPESSDVPTPTHESPRAVSDADTRPTIAAAQPPIETPKTSVPVSPARTTIETATEKEQPRTTSLVESGPPRLATRNKTLTEQGTTSAKSHAESPNEKGNSQGEEMNDAGSGTKSAKPDLPVKQAPNQKDIPAQEGTGLLSVFPGPANGTSRTSPRTETSPGGPPSTGQVSTDVETNPSVRPQPIREISLRLADKASNPVDIQMVERGGHVQVAVRTPDQELTKSLQTNLGELVGRLEQKGYKTETWVPGAPLHTSAALTESAGSSGHSQDQPGHSSSWDGGQQQHQEHQESGRRQQARWMTQFEQTLNGEDEGTDSIPMEDQ